MGADTLPVEVPCRDTGPTKSKVALDTGLVRRKVGLVRRLLAQQTRQRDFMFFSGRPWHRPVGNVDVPTQRYFDEFVK